MSVNSTFLRALKDYGHSELSSLTVTLQLNACFCSKPCLPAKQNLLTAGKLAKFSSLYKVILVTRSLYYQLHKLM